MKILDFFKQDGWVNSVLGFGQALTDKRMSGYHRQGPEPSRDEYESLYTEDGLAARIIEALPDAALRQGYELTTDSQMDAELRVVAESTINARADELQVIAHLRQAAYMGRLFGGSVLLIATSDQDWAKPLNPLHPGELLYLGVYDRHEVIPKTRYSDIKNKSFGEIESYSITPSDGLGGSVIVHASRLLLFGGSAVSRREWARLGYWQQSVLRRVRDDLRDHALTWGSVANMVLDASVGVLKICNFYEIIAGKLKEQLQTRLDVINMGRTSARVLPLDTEESFEHQERTFTGLPDVLDRQMQRISSLTGIPVTVLYGRSPAGLNATGESDTRHWYDLIEDARKATFAAPLTRLIQIIAAEQFVGEPESWGIQWPSLWQETARDRADRQAVVGKLDVDYIDAGVLTPDEVALARYGSGEWSDTAPQLDLGGRVDVNE